MGCLRKEDIGAICCVLHYQWLMVIDNADTALSRASVRRLRTDTTQVCPVQFRRCYQASVKGEAAVCLNKFLVF